MDQLLAMYRSGVDEFGARTRAIREEQWDAPTPDTEWSVANLVDHLLDEQRWVPPLMHGHDLDAAAKIVAGAASTRGSASSATEAAALWDDVARASVEAFGEPDALARDVALSRGPTPAVRYIVEMIFDLIVHSWDLGKAIGYAGVLPQDAAAFLYEQVKAMGDLSETGMFDKPVVVPDNACTMDKLIALTGRDPR
jgi:uncharacterized protein (TIGR03086 family)